MKTINFGLKEFVDLVFDKCLWVIGGYENTMSDSEKDSPEYARAEDTIKDLDAILDEAYYELEHDLMATVDAEIRDIVSPKVISKLHEEGY